MGHCEPAFEKLHPLQCVFFIFVFNSELYVCVGMDLQFLNYPLPIQMMSVNEEKLNIIETNKKQKLYTLFVIIRIQLVFISTAAHRIFSL